MGSLGVAIPPPSFDDGAHVRQRAVQRHVEKFVAHAPQPQHKRRGNVKDIATSVLAQMHGAKVGSQIRVIINSRLGKSALCTNHRRSGSHGGFCLAAKSGRPDPIEADARGSSVA
jgi:hypothetical protein